MIIDLTKALDQSLRPYSMDKYADPPLEIASWCSIDQQGFAVFRLSLGTQTGTHVDAPAHFVEGGATLDALTVEHCMGNYFLIDLPWNSQMSDIEKRLDAYGQEIILFLRTPVDKAARLSIPIIKKILTLPPLLIVLSGEIESEEPHPFAFHRLIAQAGKFLAEDLDAEAAHRLTGSGELFVMPLRLSGVSGSPCRVLARMVD